MPVRIIGHHLLEIVHYRIDVCGIHNFLVQSDLDLLAGDVYAYACDEPYGVGLVVGVGGI